MVDRKPNGLTGKQAWTTRALLQIRPLFPIAASTMIVAAGIAIAFGHDHFWTLFIEVFIAAALFWLICYLGARFKVVDRAVTAFFSAVQNFVVWWIVTAVVLMVFAWVSQWI